MAVDLQEKIRPLADIRTACEGRSVIMACGTFDLVHPGHIRHLRYAKSKADALVVAVTCDMHITKGNNRPYVPESLRASNLAEFEMVDYVFIDRNPTPLEAIAYLKPAFFAKGYDYSAVPPKTQEEETAVKANGGQMLFTPGDVVYSSSHLLTVAPPRLGIEKLLALMESDGVTFSHLREALKSLSGITAHVIGDTIVDSYTYCSMIGAASKTPTLSVRFNRQDDFIGGAAVVAKHLNAAGANVDFTTVLGTDSLCTKVISDLESNGIRIKAFQDGRMTTNKNVIICEGARLLKLDRVDNRTVNDDALGKIKARIKDIPADVVIFSDFRHGIFNGSTIPALREAIPDASFSAADSQVASRWGNILDFRGFNLITPNEKEARFALGDQDSVIRPLATNLYKAAACETLILKCGEAGLLTVRSDDETDHKSVFAMDSFVHSAVDPVGAGDACLAYSSLALRAGAGPVVASILGNLAAGIECECEGNIPVEKALMLERIGGLEKVANYE